MFRLELVYKYVLRLIKRIEELFCIELSQRRLPPRSGPRSIKSLLCSIISIISCILIVYCRRFSASGIRALSLAQVGNCFLGKSGKIGRRHSHPFFKLSVHIQEKQVAYLNSYFKICSFKKNILFGVLKVKISRI